MIVVIILYFCYKSTHNPVHLPGKNIQRSGQSYNSSVIFPYEKKKGDTFLPGERYRPLSYMILFYRDIRLVTRILHLLLLLIAQGSTIRIGDTVEE